MSEASELNLSPNLQAVLNIVINKLNDPGGTGIFSETDFPSMSSDEIPIGVLRANLIKLENSGYITKRKDRDNTNELYTSTFYWTLGEKGEKFWYSQPTHLRHAVPASDRFVQINHNSPEVTAAKSNLEELEKRIKESNELTASRSERLAMISEVNGIRQLLDQNTVRVASIWAATKNSGILAWLSTHAADATIIALATEVIGHLFKICGLS